MSESKRATHGSSDRQPSPDEIGRDPDDAPELDDAWFEGADRYEGDRLVQRGLASSETESVALPTTLVERFRASGEGWQTRIEGALRDWLDEHPDRLGER